MKLFLDDERSPNDVFWKNNAIYSRSDWIIVRNFEQFQDYIIKNGIPEVISFDNDLGEPLEGYDCAKWLCETYCVDNKIKLNTIYVHSMNAATNTKIFDYCKWFNENFDNWF